MLLIICTLGLQLSPHWTSSAALASGIEMSNIGTRSVIGQPRGRRNRHTTYDPSWLCPLPGQTHIHNQAHSSHQDGNTHHTRSVNVYIQTCIYTAEEGHRGKSLAVSHYMPDLFTEVMHMGSSQPQWSNAFLSNKKDNDTYMYWEAKVSGYGVNFFYILLMWL